MNRRRKLLINTIAGLAKQGVVVICGFILPRYMILYFGSSVNGLVSSISHFLNFITFLEMGVGAVIQSNLYKPLADGDSERISEIVVASQKFFRKIAYILFVYIAVLLIIYPTVINTEFTWTFSDGLLIIISISLFAQYYFGITYQLLLNADQRAYVQSFINIITVVLNTILCVAMMVWGANVHAVKLISALVYLFQPIALAIYVRQHYHINRKIKLEGEPIKQKWNGFSQHIASVVCNNVDVVVLTLFSTLSSVSIYSVYYAVTNGITQTILTGAQGLEALFGNMLANDEKEKLYKTFETAEWVIHTTVSILYSVMAIVIVPFIQVYTNNISDANYLLPEFGIMLAVAYACMCCRIPYFRMIKAAGHYKQTQNGAYVSMALNIIISVAFVRKFGLPGVALGTIVAMFYHTCYFAWYLRKNILNRPITYFMRYIMSDVLVAVISFYATRGLLLRSVNYLSWFILCCKVGIITTLVAGLVNLVFHKQTLFSSMERILARKK